MFGVKKTTDLLEQITWGLASAVIIISLASYVMVGGSDSGAGINSINVERAQNAVVPGGKIAPAPAAEGAAPAAGEAPAGTTTPAGTATPADTTK